MKLVHKVSNETGMVACVCYLPPENSTRHVDASDFFDTLLLQIHNYHVDDITYVCGDFNGRCGNLLDYVEGVDSVENREILDSVINQQGRLLVDFMINANYCMLNGRKKPQKDYIFYSKPRFIYC